MSVASTVPTILAALQAGREEEASAVLAALLEREPANGEALALAGFLRLQKGDPAGAAALLDRALQARSGQWLAHLHRASAREALAELTAAASDYARAAELNPQPEFRVRQASLLARLHDRAGERAALEAALRLDPAFVPALNNLGLCLENAGDEAAALACFERAALAAAGKPESAEVAENLERLLFEKGKRLAAVDFEAALRFYQAEIARHPEYGGLQTGLGNLWLERCEIGQAEAAFRMALGLRPADPDACINYGIALHRSGRPAAALRLYERAEALAGGEAKPELRWNRSLSLLALGRLKEGFHDYEARVHYGAFRDLPIPRWDGRPFPGQKLLLVTEQGFGDAIQFIRYAAWAKARGGTVTVACDPPLQRLFTRAAGIDEVIGPEGLSGVYDWQIPLLSLPHLAGTDLTAIPPSNFAFSPPIRTPVMPFRVGLVWSGNPKYRNDRNRSCPIELFESLHYFPDLCWVGLQHGEAAKETPQWTRFRDFSPRLTDFQETAVCLRQIDLLISVDTATAHLAGMLGRPVWLLLPFAPDWRWMMDRDDSPWYPTARLFRQRTEGDWADVVARVGAALRALLAERG